MKSNQEEIDKVNNRIKGLEKKLSKNIQESKLCKKDVPSLCPSSDSYRSDYNKYNLVNRNL